LSIPFGFYHKNWRRSGDSVTLSPASSRFLRNLPYPHCRGLPVRFSDIKSALVPLRIP